MPLMDVSELKALLVRDGRLMALDLGTKTIGIATSDVMRMLATPLTTLKRTKLAADLAALGELTRKHEVKALVVGLPLNMDGTEGPRAQSSRAYARNCAEAFALPVLLWEWRRRNAILHQRFLLIPPWLICPHWQPVALIVFWRSTSHWSNRKRWCSSGKASPISSIRARFRAIVMMIYGKSTMGQ